MLNFELRQDDGILVLKPDGPLAAADFTALASRVDAYLKQHGMLRGVMVSAKAFPGWKDFDALFAHLKFINRHHQQVEKVAVVADGGAASIMPRIASHFIHADLKHFDHAHEDAAWDWLMENGRGQTRKAV